MDDSKLFAKKMKESWRFGNEKKTQYAPKIEEVESDVKNMPCL